MEVPVTAEPAISLPETGTGIVVGAIVVPEAVKQTEVENSVQELRNQTVTAAKVDDVSAPTLPADNPSAPLEQNEASKPSTPASPSRRVIDLIPISIPLTVTEGPASFSQVMKLCDEAMAYLGETGVKTILEDGGAAMSVVNATALGQSIYERYEDVFRDIEKQKEAENLETQSQYFHDWRRKLLIAKVVERLSSKAYGRRVSRLFLRWRGHSQRMRVARQMTMRALSARTKEAFQKFLSYHSTMKTANLKCARALSLRQREMFERWKTLVVLQKTKKRKQSIAQQNCIKLVFRQLARNRTQRKFMRENIKRALGLVAASWLAAAMEQWKASMSVSRTEMLIHCFKRWRENTALKNGLWKIQQRKQLHALKLSMVAWKGLVTSDKQKRLSLPPQHFHEHFLDGSRRNEQGDLTSRSHSSTPFGKKTSLSNQPPANPKEANLQQLDSHRSSMNQPQNIINTNQYTSRHTVGDDTNLTASANVALASAFLSQKADKDAKEEARLGEKEMQREKEKEALANGTLLRCRDIENWSTSDVGRWLAVEFRLPMNLMGANCRMSGQELVKLTEESELLGPKVLALAPNFPNLFSDGIYRRLFLDRLSDCLRNPERVIFLGDWSAFSSQTSGSDSSPTAGRGSGHSDISRMSREEITQCTVEDVASWFYHSLDLKDVAARCLARGVDGTQLLQANDLFLKSVLNVTSKLHRDKILHLLTAAIHQPSSGLSGYAGSLAEELQYLSTPGNNETGEGTENEMMTDQRSKGEKLRSMYHRSRQALPSSTWKKLRERRVRKRVCLAGLDGPGVGFDIEGDRKAVRRGKEGFTAFDPFPGTHWLSAGMASNDMTKQNGYSIPQNGTSSPNLVVTAAEAVKQKRMLMAICDAIDASGLTLEQVFDALRDVKEGSKKADIIKYQRLIQSLKELKFDFTPTQFESIAQRICPRAAVTYEYFVGFFVLLYRERFQALKSRLDDLERHAVHQVQPKASSPNPKRLLLLRKMIRSAVESAQQQLRRSDPSWSSFYSRVSSEALPWDVVKGKSILPSSPTLKSRPQSAY